MSHSNYSLQSSQRNRIVDNYVENEASQSSLGAVQYNSNQFLRLRESKVRWYHQIVVKNLLVSFYKMKDINSNNFNSPANSLYKYEKHSVSIQIVNIKENITSKGKMLLDTFHCP